MSLTKADLKAIADMIAASRTVAPRAKSRAKVAKDTRTMSERRAAAVGGECEAHGKRFATAAGASWHFGNVAHDEVVEA